MNLSLASLFSFGAGQFEKKDSFFFKWPKSFIKDCSPLALVNPFAGICLCIFYIIYVSGYLRQSGWGGRKGEIKIKGELETKKPYLL